MSRANFHRRLTVKRFAILAGLLAFTCIDAFE